MIPIHFQYTADGVMQPVQRYLGIAEKQFVVGEIYRMEVDKVEGEASTASRGYYMARVNEAFMNLPEEMAAEYPSAKALRKRALIKCKYYNLKSTVFDTEADAVRAAAYIRPMDEFAVVTVSGCVVNHYTAKSQKMKRAGGMDKIEFEKSKADVLELLRPYLDKANDEKQEKAT